jgi:hypothetical protein
VFTDDEVAYLRSQMLAVTTLGRDEQHDVGPVGDTWYPARRTVRRAPDVT